MELGSSVVFKHQNNATRTHPLMSVEGESPSTSTCPAVQAIVEMVQVRMVPLPCSSRQMHEIEDEIDGDAVSRITREERSYYALEGVYYEPKADVSMRRCHGGASAS